MSKRAEDDGTNATIPGFLTKTFEIFSTPEFEDICSWGADGDTIVVKKIDEFSKAVLPRFFKHSNFQSFVRQLNMYDFHKTVQDPSHGEFQHQNFRKDRPDLLHLIKRKAHARNASAEAKKRAADNSQVNDLRTESGAIVNEMVQLRKMKENIESRLSDMEYKQSQLMTENAMLKTSLEQNAQKQELMKQKMQKILYFMYEMYMGGTRGSSDGRRLDGPARLHAITNLGESYADAMRLLEMDPSNPRVTELAHHPAVEDLASTGSNTPRPEEHSVNHTTSNFGETRLASFDSGAASVMPPIIPFGRILSIEAPPPTPRTTPHSEPVADTQPKSASSSSSSSSNTEAKQQQPTDGSSLRRMYSVVPGDDPHLLKRPRTDGGAPEGGAPENLQADLSAWNQNQENLMTRIDSLDATLSQLLADEDLGDLQHLPSLDESYLKHTTDNHR